MEKKCKWDWFGDFWDTQCGNSFQDKKLPTNRKEFQYCPFCGKKITLRIKQ